MQQQYFEPGLRFLWTVFIWKVSIHFITDKVYLDQDVLELDNFLSHHIVV